MARKSIGYINLFWNCPNCGTQNPGPQKTCSACGAPQPADVEFVQGNQQNLLTDQEEIEKAQKGADIHCPFCGARNLAGAETCSQCGGDIQEGLRRKSGRVVGAYRIPADESAKIACPNCGFANSQNAATCSQCGASLLEEKSPENLTVTPPQPENKRKFNPLWLILGVVFLVICVLGAMFIFSMFSTQSSSGIVRSVEWQRSIDIEEMQNVTKNDWEDEIPIDATIVVCEMEYHHTQNDFAPQSTEVCGTEYIEDTGTGHGEVVQDCEYRVYQNTCDYIVQELVVVDEAIAHGNDNQPVWPQPVLATGQTAGTEHENYTISFESDGKTLDYHTSDAELFSRCIPGSHWTLNINAFGDINSIEVE